MAGAMDTFTTARLVAERLTHELMAEVYRQDADEAFMALIGGVRTREETDKRFEPAFEAWERDGFGVWLLRERESGEIIGRAVLRRLTVEGVSELEVGYAFYEPYWGRGLGTEIAGAIVELARRELGAKSFVALTDLRNDASRRVLEKVGFKYAGEYDHDGVVLNLFRAQ